jgi:hypothetical protein
MPDLDITPRQLHNAARQTWKLNDLLDKAMSANVMPLLIGFDLDYLATRLEQAADELERRNNA